MQYTFVGLILATLFGMFFGSEGRIESELFDIIFWGLIGTGVLLHILVISRDSLCQSCNCFFCTGKGL